MVTDAQFDAIRWWGFTLALAVEDDHEESRSQVEEAIGMSGQQFWNCLKGLDMEGQESQTVWGSTLYAVAQNLDRVGSRPGPGDRGYDPVLGTIAEAMSRLAHGILNHNSACLPR